MGNVRARSGLVLSSLEVGEISLELQCESLQVSQGLAGRPLGGKKPREAITSGWVERVMDEKTRTEDLRIIAPTNRNLPEEVEAVRRSMVPEALLSCWA